MSAIDDTEILGGAEGQVPKFDFGADQCQKARKNHVRIRKKGTPTMVGRGPAKSHEFFLKKLKSWEKISEI